jgi:hypothetical protein
MRRKNPIIKGFFSKCSPNPTRPSYVARIRVRVGDKVRVRVRVGDRVRVRIRVRDRVGVRISSVVGLKKDFE